MSTIKKLDDIMLASILADDDYDVFRITEHYQLTENEIKLVVKEWYLNGMCLDILQTEDGIDLEELLDLEF
jgi:hypothetical protein